MQKPSDGAMRAARAMIADVDKVLQGHGEPLEVYSIGLGFSDLQDALVERYALIIDRETGWILCSDRMPKEYGLYLTFEQGTILFTEYCGAGVGWEKYNPTHWQPCSTPPEES